MSVVLVSGQFFGSYDNAYRFGYNSLSGEDFGSGPFGGPGSFGGFGSGLSTIRDPRQNRGKIHQSFVFLFFFWFFFLRSKVRGLQSL